MKNPVLVRRVDGEPRLHQAIVNKDEALNCGRNTVWERDYEHWSKIYGIRRAVVFLRWGKLGWFRMAMSSARRRVLAFAELRNFR